MLNTQFQGWIATDFKQASLGIRILAGNRLRGGFVGCLDSNHAATGLPFPSRNGPANFSVPAALSCSRNATCAGRLSMRTWRWPRLSGSVKDEDHPKLPFRRYLAQVAAARKGRRELSGVFALSRRCVTRRASSPTSVEAAAPTLTVHVAERFLREPLMGQHKLGAFRV